MRNHLDPLIDQKKSIVINNALKAILYRKLCENLRNIVSNDEVWLERDFKLMLQTWLLIGCEQRPHSTNFYFFVANLDFKSKNSLLDL